MKPSATQNQQIQSCNSSLRLDKTLTQAFRKMSSTRTRSRTTAGTSTRTASPTPRTPRRRSPTYRIPRWLSRTQVEGRRSHARLHQSYIYRYTIIWRVSCVMLSAANFPFIWTNIKHSNSTSCLNTSAACFYYLIVSGAGDYCWSHGLSTMDSQDELNEAHALTCDVDVLNLNRSNISS